MGMKGVGRAGKVRHATARAGCSSGVRRSAGRQVRACAQVCGSARETGTSVGRRGKA